MLKPRRRKKCWQPMASKVLEQSSKEFSAPKIAILSDIFGARVSHSTSSQPKHCFDSWESSNNRKYYFTSIKLREWEIIFLSLHGEETSLESRENNFVLSSFKYILPWTAEISQHFSLIYRGENIFLLSFAPFKISLTFLPALTPWALSWSFRFSFHPARGLAAAEIKQAIEEQ